MVISRNLSFLLGSLLIVEVAGCAQDGSFRPHSRSVAMVGDKTEAIVSGEPGSSIASTVPDYPPDRPKDAKISGRVVDDHGREVPNASVRLAIAGAKGGRIEKVEADDSGAFTLRRLREGSSYVVIAEAKDGDEVLVGRAEVKAPRTSLKIKVYPRSEGTDHFRTSSNSARLKVGKASSVQEEDDEEPDEQEVDLDRPRPKSRVNREDFDPPAPEAESLDRLNKGPIEIDIQDDPDTPARDQDSETDRRSSAKRRSSRKYQPVKQPSGEFEEDENPLPPAIEEADSGESPKGEDGQPEKAKIANSSDEPARRKLKLIVAYAKPPVEAEEPLRPAVDPPVATEKEAPVSVVKNEAPVPVVKTDAEVIVASTTSQSLFDVPRPSPIAIPITPQTLFEEGPKPARRSSTVAERPRVARSAVPARMPSLPAAVATDSLFAVESASATSRPAFARSRTKTPPTRTAKWGDIARNQEVPLDESLRKHLALQARAEPEPERAATPDRTQPKERIRTDAAVRTTAMSAAEPRLSPGAEKLYEFELPDAQGKKLSLKDFKSELILLDFWGTWCAPCKTSIPRLVELQNRYGPDRLQVVGIACERVGSFRRSSLVAKTQKDLGINYPVMITGKDDPCLLTDVMQVRFYPTMILLDRNGEVILREEGATPKTLEELAATIEATLNSK